MERQSDETNPCLGTLITKKGLKTTDGIMFSEASFRRENAIVTIQNGHGSSHIRPEYPERYPAELSSVHQQFSEWIMDHSQAKVVVIFGSPNAKRFAKRFPELILVCNLMRSTETFAGRVFIQPQTMRSPSRIIITCNHPETLIYAGSRLTYRQNCLFDYVINLACALAGVYSEIDSTCFTEAAGGIYQPLDGHHSSLQFAMDVIESEIASGEDPLPEHVPSMLVLELQSVSPSWHQNISVAFDRLIYKITGRHNPEEIIRTAARRGNEVLRAAGYPNLRRAHETMRAAGYPNLRRGHETMRAAGYPSLQHGRETLRAAGFPHSRRGNEVRRGAGYLSLARGRETMKAAGWPHLRRINEARRAAGDPNLQRRLEIDRAAGWPALRRGRETQRIAGIDPMRRAIKASAKKRLDDGDRRYGFQRATGTMRTSIELQCGHDDRQEPLPPDLDPRYTSKGEYLAKIMQGKGGKKAHPGCTHTRTLAIPQNDSIDHVDRRKLMQKLKTK